MNKFDVNGTQKCSSYILFAQRKLYRNHKHSTQFCFSRTIVQLRPHEVIVYIQHCSAGIDGATFEEFVFKWALTAPTWHGLCDVYSGEQPKKGSKYPEASGSSEWLIKYMLTARRVFRQVKTLHTTHAACCRELRSCFGR